MIKIENVVLPSPAQWRAVVRGMRNPMNSWEKSDSYVTHIENPETLNTADFQFFLGENDLALMKKLVDAGNDHGKFMRMIPVYADITAPLYWWKEFDTYKIGTVASSCSTMHKIAAKEFALDDFSWDQLSNETFHVVWNVDWGNRDYLDCPIDCLIDVIALLNTVRDRYLETGEKVLWWQLIQLLPSSYNQRRTVMLNYEVLRNICRKGRRLDHKLDEWREFCKWALALPYFKEIVGGVGDE